MSKKKRKNKNKKYSNYNNSIIYDNYFKDFYEFDIIRSEKEKFEKCFKLIKDSAKIKEPKEKDKYIYYYSLAELYYCKSKKESQQYNFSDGTIFNVNAILEEKNREYLKKIIKDKEFSFENYLKCWDIINNSNTNNKHDRITEGIRIISQELSTIYYIIDDEEKFLLYGKYAVEFNSLNSIYIFLKYYCEKQDYDNAYIYYNLMNNYRSGRLNNPYQDTMIKKISYPIYYKFLYDSGMYEDSLNVAKEFKKYVIDNELIENKREIIKPVNEHIEKCQILIDKSKKIQYKEDLLSNYFDKEILKLMSDDNKIYILTSLNIYEYMKSEETTMDYSATLMPILKAIENIIFEIIAEKYHDFIMKKNEKNQINPREIRAFINQKDNKFIEKMDQLELGSALYLIGYKYFENDELIIRKNFQDFCNENNVKNFRDVIIKMYNELDELRRKRNLVAHKNRVFEECVKECYDILLNDIKFINFLYTNFRFVFEKNTEERQ